MKTDVLVIIPRPNSTKYLTSLLKRWRVKFSEIAVKAPGLAQFASACAVGWPVGSNTLRRKVSHLAAFCGPGLGLIVTKDREVSEIDLKASVSRRVGSLTPSNSGAATGALGWAVRMEKNGTSLFYIV